MIPVKGIIIKEDQDGQGAAGILVALASEFWGLGCPEIYNEVATRLSGAFQPRACTAESILRKIKCFRTHRYSGKGT